MEKPNEIRRICKWCGKQYELTKKQMRQVISKWPAHCSRSCSKRTQNAEKHGHKREHRNCQMCGESFVVVNWNKEKVFCSNQCASTSRFGEKDASKTRDRLNQILKDEKYKRYLDGVARRISFKYGRGEEFKEELTQEFFKSLWEGFNTTIENVAKDMLRSELKKGIVGKRNSDFRFNSVEMLKQVKEMSKFLGSQEFVEYVVDCSKILNETEQRFLNLYLKGITKPEVIDELRRQGVRMSNEKFHAMSKKF